MIYTSAIVEEASLLLDHDDGWRVTAAATPLLSARQPHLPAAVFVFLTFGRNPAWRAVTEQLDIACVFIEEPPIARVVFDRVPSGRAGATHRCLRSDNVVAGQNQPPPAEAPRVN